LKNDKWKIKLEMEGKGMNTRDIAKEYRLTHWRGVMKRRAEMGLNIKQFCEAEGIHENTYYYWQRKLREAAVSGMQTQTIVNKNGKAIPSGWTECTITDLAAKQSIKIKIGKCRVEVTKDTEMELLGKVCSVLAELC
jgi:transposase-like protein